MPRDTNPGSGRPQLEAALDTLTASAADNIPGVDCASITVNRPDQPLRTMAASDPLAAQADSLQYELREGPCYAAVTDERFVLINDMADAAEFPSYGPKALALGVGAQAAVQLIHNGESAGLNLYSHTARAFDHSTVHLAELFANQGAVLLGYDAQVEQLSNALHSRTDIGTAVGIIMERYGIDQPRAFAFLVRNSQTRNIKVRVLAHHVIAGTFQSTPSEDRESQHWP